MLTFVAPANAQTVPSTTDSTSTATSDKPQKPVKICRQEAPTGSHFAKRICHTEAQWTAIHAAEDHQGTFGATQGARSGR
ncbi:MAG: hypothetical protein V4472_17870 [Pseudomonadota bacterium]